MNYNLKVSTAAPLISKHPRPDFRILSNHILCLNAATCWRNIHFCWKLSSCIQQRPLLVAAQTLCWWYIYFSEARAFSVNNFKIWEKGLIRIRNNVIYMKKKHFTMYLQKTGFYSDPERWQSYQYPLFLWECYKPVLGSSALKES